MHAGIAAARRHTAERRISEAAAAVGLKHTIGMA